VEWQYDAAEFHNIVLTMSANQVAMIESQIFPPVAPL